MRILKDNVLIERTEINSNTNLLLNKWHDNFARIVLVNDNKYYKQGDIIAFSDINKTIIHIDDKEYLIIKQKDILLVV